MVSLYEQGWTVPELAARFGVSTGTIGNRMRTRPEYQPRPIGGPAKKTAPLRARYEAGATLGDLAQQEGVSGQTIGRRLRAEGVTLRRYTGKRGPRLNTEEYAPERLLEMSNQGMTCEEIGLAIGKPPEATRRAMVRRGIPRQEGKPRPGHNYFWRGGMQVDKHGYILVKTPGHPDANHQGYVRMHRLVMERTLGRPLAEGEVVDHRDGDTSNNDPDNLRLFPSNAEHLRVTMTGTKNLPREVREERRQAAVLRARQRVAAILSERGGGAGQ